MHPLNISLKKTAFEVLNDVTLRDLAALCDAFYIGGTKCGALFGEALVIPEPEKVPHLFTMIKQHGALLAKGRLLGIQFETLFSDAESDCTLYHDIGCYAIRMAERMEQIIRDKGYEFYLDTPTNQKFVIMTDEQLERIKGKIEYGFWEKPDQKHTVICLATSWSTTDEVLDKLAEAL